MKTKIIILLLTCLNLFAAPNTIAQKLKKAAKPEAVADVRDRQLIVLLRSEDEAITKKLNLSELKAYRESISKLNSSLKVVIKELWTFNKEIHYLTKQQIASLDHQNNKYAVIALETIDIRLANQITRGPANQVVRLHVSLVEDYNPLKPVFYQDLVGVHTEHSVPGLRKMDIVAATLFIQNHFEARLEGKKRKGGLFFEEIQENAGTLQSKILLIDTTFMEEDLQLAEIKENYPFAFEISNEKIIESAQLKKDSRYAYVYLFPVASAANTFYHCVLDGESGKVISYSFPSGFHMKNLVDGKHLKNYARYSDSNKNKSKN